MQCHAEEHPAFPGWATCLPYVVDDRRRLQGDRSTQWLATGSQDDIVTLRTTCWAVSVFKPPERRWSQPVPCRQEHKLGQQTSVQQSHGGREKSQQTLHLRKPYLLNGGGEQTTDVEVEVRSFLYTHEQADPVSPITDTSGAVLRVLSSSGPFPPPV